MGSASLLALATAEQQNAKRFLYRTIPLLQAATAACATAALFVEVLWAYLFGLGALSLQSAIWALRRHASALHARAEEARRRALLIETLGVTAERLDVASIRLGFSKRACRESEGLHAGGYWAAGMQAGPQRLSAALQESAFWSSALYGAAARSAAHVLVAVAVALAMIVLVGIVAFEGDTAIAVARVVVVGLSAFIALDLLGQILAWRAAASRAEAVDRRLEALDGRSVEPLLAVVADYAVATASAPPIPDRIYRANRDRLEELWREHRNAP